MNTKEKKPQLSALEVKCNNNLKMQFKTVSDG
jgi:hypothetical protein